MLGPKVLDEAMLNVIFAPTAGILGTTVPIFLVMRHKAYVPTAELDDVCALDMQQLAGIKGIKASMMTAKETYFFNITITEALSNELASTTVETLLLNS